MRPVQVQNHNIEARRGRLDNVCLFALLDLSSAAMTSQCARVLSSIPNRLPILYHHCPSIMFARLSGNYIHTKANNEGEKGLRVSSKMIEVVGNGADGCCRSVLLRIGDSRFGSSTDE